MGMRKYQDEIPMVYVQNLTNIDIHVGHKVLRPGRGFDLIAKDVAEKLADSNQVKIFESVVFPAKNTTFESAECTLSVIDEAANIPPTVWEEVLKSEPSTSQPKAEGRSNNFPPKDKMFQCKHCDFIGTPMQLAQHTRKMHPKPKTKKGKKNR